MSFSSCLTDLWTPRRRSFSVKSPNQRSTWFSQEELDRREMNMEPRVLVQPFLDSWRLVRRVIARR